MGTTSELETVETAARQRHRARQVLQSRPMSLNEPPQPLRLNTVDRVLPVLQSRRSGVQRSLF